MIQVVTVILLLAAAVGAFMGANACQPGPAQQGLLMLAGALVSATLPSLPSLLAPKTAGRSTEAGHATPSIFFLGVFTMVAVVFAMAMPSMGCKNIKTDQFFEAVVDCAKVNPESSAASAAVLTCLTSAISGNPAACLTGLVTEGHWTVDEVACIVAYFADRESKKVGTPALGPDSIAVRNAAVNWLVQEHIAIQNSYPGAQ